MIKIISTEPISFAEAKDILEKKDEKDLGHEQRVTLDHLRKIKIIDKETVKKLKEELSKELPVLKEHQIMTIINFVPKIKEEVETLFMKERITLTKEQIEKILAITKKIC